MEDQNSSINNNSKNFGELLKTFETKEPERKDSIKSEKSNTIESLFLK